MGLGYGGGHTFVGGSRRFVPLLTIAAYLRCGVHLPALAGFRFSHSYTSSETANTNVGLSHRAKRFQIASSALPGSLVVYPYVMTAGAGDEGM